jgi:aspartoacylase
MTTPKPRVVLVGGTHGNEITGVGLVEHWQKHPAEIQRPGVEVTTILGNPVAARAVVRYIDHDLNRCFLPRDLLSARHGYEFARAREIVELCGGETVASESVVVDLHTTTSNMGPTVILTSINPFNVGLSQALVRRMPNLRVITNALAREASPFVNGISPFGFCIEVGPVAQGCIDPRVVAQTRALVAAVLDHCAAVLSGHKSVDRGQDSLEVFDYAEVVDYPRTSDGGLAAMIHPERYGRDFVPVERGSPMFLTWDGQVITRQAEGVFWPIFVGESAYVEKQTAMVLTRRRRVAGDGPV